VGFKRLVHVAASKIKQFAVWKYCNGKAIVKFIGNRYQGCFPAVMRQELETDHSPPFGVEVGNGGAFPPLPHVFMA
jgi:hypothetical protein